VPGLKAQSIDYFSKQIDLCVDNKMFGTAWTNHTIMPGIEHKDKRPTRPSFKSDVSGKNRFFAGASSSTMEKYEKYVTKCIQIAWITFLYTQALYQV